MKPSHPSFSNVETSIRKRFTVYRRALVGSLEKSGSDTTLGGGTFIKSCLLGCIWVLSISLKGPRYIAHVIDFSICVSNCKRHRIANCMTMPSQKRETAPVRLLPKTKLRSLQPTWLFWLWLQRKRQPRKPSLRQLVLSRACAAVTSRIARIVWHAHPPNCASMRFTNRFS